MELFHTDRLFHHNFGVFPLDQIAHVGVSPSISLKLFGCEIIFEEFQPVWSRYLNVTDRQTDRRLTVASRITALCVASRVKNCWYCWTAMVRLNGLLRRRSHLMVGQTLA